MGLHGVFQGEGEGLRWVPGLGEGPNGRVRVPGGCLGLGEGPKGSVRVPGGCPGLGEGPKGVLKAGWGS